jgi:signal transduction histidine kinase/PAS domain-containing protein
VRDRQPGSWQRYVWAALAAVVLTELAVGILFFALPSMSPLLELVLHVLASVLLAVLILYLLFYRRLLADVAARARAGEDLRHAIAELDRRVEERSEELSNAREALIFEIAQRQGAEEGLERYALALERERRRLFSLLDGLPAVIYAKAPDHTIRFANRQFRTRYGDPKEAPCYAAVHGRTAPCEKCPTASVLQDGQAVVWEQTYPDGRHYQLHDYPYVDVDGTELVLQLGIDITARRAAEEARERALDELRALSQQEHEQRRFAEGLVEVALALGASLELDQVLDRILEQTQRVVPGAAAAIILRDAKGIALARYRGLDRQDPFAHPERRGLPAEAVPLLADVCEERRPVWIQDAQSAPQVRSIPGMERVGALALAPLVAGGHVAGLIGLFGPASGSVTATGAAHLQVFATHAALAVENARRYEAEQRARRAAETLSSISLELSTTLDLDAALEVLLDHLERIVPYDAARIRLADGEGRLVVHPLRSEAARRGSSVLGAAPSPDSGTGAIQSWISTPLVVKGQSIGLCELGRRAPRTFSDQDVQWVEALVGQAATAVQHAQMFRQVQASEDELRALSRRLVDVQEKERRRIARELHDEASQTLTSLAVGLKLLQRQAGDADAVSRGSQELLGALEDVMENLHRLAVDLRPAALDRLGLATALQRLCQSVGRASRLEVQFEVVGLPDRLPPYAQTALYRIAQEALTNVVRHASATRADVILGRRNGVVFLVVEDDGRGFDPAAMGTEGRLGLVGMRERVEALSGALSIESAAERGTTIEVEVPLGNQDPDR